MSNSNTAPLIMRKSDFVISPYSECVLKEGKHLPITIEQAKFVYQNPSVNGPKVCLFYATTVGMDRSVADAAFLDLLRKAQEDKDNGAEQFVPKVDDGETVKETELGADVPPQGDASNSAALDDMRKFLIGLKTREAVLEYAKATLDVTVDVHHKAGLEKVVQAVCDAVLAKSAKSA